MKKSIIFIIFLLLQGSVLHASRTRQFDEGMKSLLAGNYAEAYCQWKPLAKRGNPDAQYNLAWLYANGNGMNIDVERALFWWGKAAEKGHSDAEFAVGLAYMTGGGIKQDLQLAISWFIKAAQNGSADAQEVIERLSNDPSYKLVKNFPQVLNFDWFGFYAIVQTDRANIRSGAGTQYKIINVKNKGDKVRVVHHRGSWSMIVYDSETKGKTQLGWIFNKLMKKTAL